MDRFDTISAPSAIRTRHFAPALSVSGSALVDHVAPERGPRRESWYAVRTRSNHEKIASDRLLARGMRAYLPTFPATCRRRDATLSIERPLFSGYLFVKCELDAQQKRKLLQAPGVVTIVGFCDGPVAIPDWQIDSLKAVLASKRPVELIWKLLPGKRVRIVGGALKGVEGTILEPPNGRRCLVISVQLLGRSVTVEITSENVEPVI